MSLNIWNNDLNKQAIARQLNEEFFDEHPNPNEIEITNFEHIKRVTIYKSDSDSFEPFLIEVVFNNWKQCAKHYKLICQIFGNSDHLLIYRKRKKLFLRKLLF
jgi:hypothetical protein